MPLERRDVIEQGMGDGSCTYCQNSIESVTVKCVECKQFDLCLQCASCGVEIGSHKKDHDYIVLDKGGFPLFDQGELSWNASQELQLLEAVEQYGFGNWQDISEKVEDKSADECQDHYVTFFVQGVVGKSTLPTEFTKKVRDHTTQDGGPLSPSLTSPLPPVNVSLQEQHLLGYMPLRDDFIREYDNDAETIISGLDTNIHDDELDNAFKLAQVDMYTRRLKERQRRKQIIREHNIAREAYVAMTRPKCIIKRKQYTAEKMFKDKIRVFARFHSGEDHAQLYENIQKIKHTKVKIRELFQYRRKGITKFNGYKKRKKRRRRRKGRYYK